MIKNTIIVTQTEAAQHYLDNVMDHLTATRGDLHFEEYSDDLLTLTTEVSNLRSQSPAVAQAQLAELFRIGCTMMLIPHHEETLEEWSNNNEDFQIAVFTDDGKPIGLFKSEQVAW